MLTERRGTRRPPLAPQDDDMIGPAYELPGGSGGTRQPPEDPGGDILAGDMIGPAYELPGGGSGPIRQPPQDPGGTRQPPDQGGLAGWPGNPGPIKQLPGQVPGKTDGPISQNTGPMQPGGVKQPDTRGGGPVKQAPDGGGGPVKQAPTEKLTSLRAQIDQTTDPAEKARLNDQLARDAYTDLRDAGHDAKWEKDGSLMVDGRRYTVGTGAQAAAAPTGPEQPMQQLGRVTPPTNASYPTLHGGTAAQAGAQLTEPGPGVQLTESTPEQMAQGQANHALAYQQQQAEHAAGNGQSPLGWGIDPSVMGPNGGAPQTAGATGTDFASQGGGQPPAGGGGPNPAWNTDGYMAPTVATPRTGPAPAGFDPAKWADPNHQTPKYGVTGILTQFDLTKGLTPEIMAKVAESYPGATMMGRDKINFPGIGPIDVIGGSATGQGRPQWIDLTHEAQNAGGGGVQGIDAGTGMPGVSGPPQSVPGPTTPDPTFAGQTGPAPPTKQAPYTPGEIGFDDINDLPGLEELMKMMGPAYEPGDLSGLDSSELDNQSEQAALNLLKNPHSLDDKTVDTLKGRNKDELAEMQAADAENMLATSYERGTAGSAFDKAEQNASRRDRDRGIIGSNREIDVQAAATRKGDEKSALELANSIRGQSYSQKHGTATLKEGAKQAAAQSRQSMVSTATQASLQKAALTGDRMQLRESVKQEAARLKISEDELTQRGAIAAMQDATQRLGLNINMQQFEKQLAQNGRQFAEEMMFKLAQMGQNDRQFGAQYGLDVAKFSAGEDQRGIDNMFAATFGGG